MAIKTYTNPLTEGTPQNRPIPGREKDQVKNSAGGYSFKLDDWGRLHRFLILGTEGGSYYSSQRDLTVENTGAVLRCIQEDGVRAVGLIAEISNEGRAPKNDPAIFALALALKHGDQSTKTAARNALGEVCRIGTHIFQLSAALKAVGPAWSKAARKGIQNWYRSRDERALSYQLIKYRQRDGWTHKDVLRLAHVRPTPEIQNALSWAVGKETDALPLIIAKFDEAQSAENPKQVVDLIREFNLPREAIPTKLLNDASVWDALLRGGKGMPINALIRNLGKMTSIGLIAPLSDAAKFVSERLSNEEVLKKGRVHPISVLMAQLIYKNGAGFRGKLTWTPVGTVSDVLENAFHKSFKFVAPTGKRWSLALDVSSSMDWGQIAGTFLTPRVASAAMAMVTARTEPSHYINAFSHTFRAVDITPSQSLDTIVKKVSQMGFGGTDCSVPMTHALENKIPVDVFVVYTDNETWVGGSHPSEALRKYRDKMGIPAKLVVVGMVANDFTIADPNDSGMMDVVGFDTAVPNIMADFALQ